MTPISVRLGVSGDGEDDASMPGPPTDGLAKPEAVADAVAPAADLSATPLTRLSTCRRRLRPVRPPVGYAIDPAVHLSATPLTLIGDVAGVADRPRNLSLA